MEPSILALYKTLPASIWTSVLTLLKPFSVSERYARQLLSAWYERNDAKFLTHLESAPILGKGGSAIAEQERLDLIRDLARTVREESSRKEELDAALDLMHQLARWNDASYRTTSSI